MIKSLVAAAGLILAGSVAGQAADYKPTLENYLKSNVMIWVHDPVIISAIAAKNVNARAGFGRNRRARRRVAGRNRRRRHADDHSGSAQ